MYKVMGKKVVVIVLSLVTLLAVSFLSGCDSSMTLQSKIFYKGENGDREYLSREANPARTYSLSWGDANRGKEDKR